MEYDTEPWEDAEQVQADREERQRKKRLEAEEKALSDVLSAVDLKSWYAANTGSAHAPLLKNHENMTPIDTRPIDPYLGCVSITEIMRRTRDESHVSDDGTSLPSGGSGSFSGGGKAKKRKPIRGVVGGEKGPEPVEESNTVYFRVKCLTPGEFYFASQLSIMERLAIAKQHLDDIIQGRVQFVYSVKGDNSPGYVSRSSIDIWRLTEQEAELLRLHRGSMRQALCDQLRAKYGQRIKEYDESARQDIAS
jgi:hypothetical protein